MTTRVYSFANGGLPSDTSHGIGEFTRMLKASLVTGFGEKQGAGWHLIYDSQDEDRLILRSFSPRSSQYFFEIIGNLSDVFKISMAQECENNQLINPVTAYVSKIGSAWTGDCFVVANDSFVWFGVNHAIGAFGDYTALNVNPTPVIFGSQSTTISDRQMSTNLSHSQSCFFNHAKQSMFLRSFNGLNGFTLSTSGATYQTNYGDSQGVHLVRYVDVMTRENDKYSVQGYMPHLLYCDVLLENGDLTPQNKKIYQSPVLSGTGKLLFEVDEL